MLSEQTAYHAQQAAEKALKAFLTGQNHSFPKTHNLEVLVAKCQSLERSFEQYVDTARILSYYGSASQLGRRFAHGNVQGHVARSAATSNGSEQLLRVD